MFDDKMRANQYHNFKLEQSITVPNFGFIFIILGRQILMLKLVEMVYFNTNLVRLKPVLQNRYTPASPL